MQAMQAMQATRAKHVGLTRMAPRAGYEAKKEGSRRQWCTVLVWEQQEATEIFPRAEANATEPPCADALARAGGRWEMGDGRCAGKPM